MRFFFALFSLLALLAAAPAQHQTGANGVVDFLRSGASTFDRDATKALKADVIRFGAGWSLVEQKKGTYSWGTLDDRVRKTVENGARPYLILDARNDLYGGNPVTETSIAAYAKFCAAVAYRYRAYSPVYEIANEPNESRFWNNPSPYAYGAAAVPAAKAIKAKVPAAYVAVFAISGTDTGWMLPVLQLGILQYADAVSFHPYGDYAEPEVRPIWYEKIRKVVNEYKGDRCIDLIVSENGWSTGAMMPDIAPSAWTFDYPNLCPQTNWNKINARLEGGEVDPFGGTGAFKLSAVDATRDFGISAGIAGERGKLYTASVWVRTDGPVVALALGPKISGLYTVAAGPLWRRVSATLYHDGSTRVFKIASLGNPEVPVYIYRPMTEMNADYSAETWLLLKERTVANRLSRQIAADKASGIRMTIWYDGKDSANSYNASRENYFGLWASNRLKEAHKAFKAITNSLTEPNP